MKHCISDISARAEEWMVEGGEKMIISQRFTLYFWITHVLVPGGSAVFRVLVIEDKAQSWIKEGLFTRMNLGTVWWS